MAQISIMNHSSDDTSYLFAIIKIFPSLYFSNVIIMSKGCTQTQETAISLQDNTDISEATKCESIDDKKCFCFRYLKIS